MALRRMNRTASFAVIGAAILCFKQGKASVFCSASGVPLTVGDNTGRRALRAREPSTDFAQNVHGALGYRTEAGPAASRSLESDPASAAPEQVHIALAASGSLEEYAMTIAWATWPEVKSQVVWGASADHLSNLAEGSATTYSTHHPGRADYTSGFLHSATLQGLTPSTTYYYRCGDESLAMSSVRSFVTPPKIGGEETITLGILGDLGQTNDSAWTLAAIDGDASLDIVLHAGDLSYADCDQPRWDSFMRMLDPVASRLPWMVAPGNHEIEAGSTGGKPFVAYEHRFRMPAFAPPVSGHECGAGGGLDGLGVACGEGLGGEEADAAAIVEAARVAAAGGGAAGKTVGAAIRNVAREARQSFGAVDVSGAEGEADGEEEEEEEPVSCCPSEWSGTYDFGNSFYSFDVGPVHVVVMNPYTATGEDSEQYAWVQQDLESVDRTLTPWIIAMMHCPWYNSNLAHQGERQTETAMRAMEPLLYEHKTALIISGHVHAYERTHPVVDFEITEDGPTYLVVGGAGNREGHAAGFYSWPEWSAFRDGTMYGSGRLAIKGSSLALWEWTASGETVGVHDVAWISNPYSPYSPGEELLPVDGGEAPSDEESRGARIGGLHTPRLAEKRSRFS